MTMNKDMKEILLKYLEHKKGRKLTPDELAQELNGIGFVMLIEEFQDAFKKSKATSYDEWMGF